LLGLVVGYERSYHGRAAGMRTYGLVCMASAALTVIAGYPLFWYGGNHLVTASDPTRIVQGIVTGVGFLGAGVIMKDGLSISGLTTAASIWAVSSVGVLIGAGFYSAGIIMAVVMASCMPLVAKVEGYLPHRETLALVMRFKIGYVPHEEEITQAALKRGYRFVASSLAVKFIDAATEWHFLAESLNKHEAKPISSLAADISAFEGIDNFTITRARN